AKIA
ncbi:hypothetical protein, partial [Plasmodium yoelii yoelii]